VKVDRDKVLRQGIDIAQVYQTLQAFMGGYFVNYFNRFGRQWQVYVQAEGDSRTKVENVGQFFVTNDRGDPVPLSSVTTTERNLTRSSLTAAFCASIDSISAFTDRITPAVSLTCTWVEAGKGTIFPPRPAEAMPSAVAATCA